MGVNALEVRRRVLLAQPHEAVASGAIASFRTDVVSGLPMEFDLVPIQAGTGDPSPDNIRPITGHDGFTVYDDPKYGGLIWWNQLVKISVSDTSKEQNNVRIVDNRDGSYTISTNGVASAVTYIGGTKIDVNVGHKYYYRSGVPVDNRSNLRSYIISVGSINAVKVMTKGAIYRADASANVSFVPAYVASGASISTPITIYPIMIDMTEAFGSELTEQILAMTAEQAEAWFDNLFPLDYYAYNSGETTCVSAVSNLPYTKRETEFPTPPGTVYGGHVKDNGDGTYDLRVNRAYIGGSDWVQYNSSPGFKAYRIQNVPVSYATVQSAEPMSNVINEYGNFNSGSMTKNIIQLPANVYGIYMALQEDFDASNVYVTYLIKEPVTYTGLTLTAIQSLIGQNHIWIDNADSVSVEYWGH